MSTNGVRGIASVEAGRTPCADTRHFYPRALVSTILPGESCSAPSPSCTPVRTGVRERIRVKEAHFTISDGFSGILAGGGLWQGVFRHTSWVEARCGSKASRCGAAGSPRLHNLNSVAIQLSIPPRLPNYYYYEYLIWDFCAYE